VGRGKGTMSLPSPPLPLPPLLGLGELPTVPLLAPPSPEPPLADPLPPLSVELQYWAQIWVTRAVSPAAMVVPLGSMCESPCSDTRGRGCEKAKGHVVGVAGHSHNPAGARQHHHVGCSRAAASSLQAMATQRHTDRRPKQCPTAAASGAPLGSTARARPTSAPLRSSPQARRRWARTATNPAPGRRTT
jgi:hypothetical protein